MKYLVRSLKYLVYFVVIFFVTVGIVYMFSLQKDSGLTFTGMFQEGSAPKLIGFFILVAIFYPALGFGKRKLYLNGEFSKYYDIIGASMKEMDYVEIFHDENKVVYRAKSTSKKISRMFEDAITFDISNDLVEIEGLRKDVARVLSNVSYKIRMNEESETL